MTRLSLLSLSLCSLLANSGCSGPDPIIFASREAPLGQVVMQLYEDGTFSFENRGLRGASEETYQGTYFNHHDTLSFLFQADPPWAGCTSAILTDRLIIFDGCLGSLEIHPRP